MTEAQRKGTTSELLAQQYFIGKNCIVSTPLNDFSEYDFVADIDGKLQRVQVKTIFWNNYKNRWYAKCVTDHVKANDGRSIKKYSLDSFDLAAFVCLDCNAIYIIPVECIAGRYNVTFYPDGKDIPKSDRYPNFEKYRQELFAS